MPRKDASGGSGDQDVKQQLKALTLAVQGISEKLESMSPHAASTASPARAASPARSATAEHRVVLDSATAKSRPALETTALTRVLSQTSDSGRSMDEEQELLRQLRPQFYPHTPRARKDKIESIIGARDDKIQLEGMEGIFNLSGLLLGFAFFYLVLRNLNQYGLRFNLDTFWCSGAPRDFALAALSLLPAGILTCCVFLTEYAFVHGYIGASAMVALYVICNALHLVVPCIVSYNTQIAPLAMALVLLAVLILMLKNHSYVATNFAMRLETLVLKHEEEEAERKASSGSLKELACKQGEASSGSLKELACKQGEASSGSLKELACKQGEVQKLVPGGQEGVRNRKGAARTGDAAAGEEQGEQEEERKDGDEGEDEEDGGLSGTGLESDSSDSSQLAPKHLLKAAVHAATLHTSLKRLQGGNSKGQRKALLQFPNNVRFSQFLYFVFAPTLVYEPLYPRSAGPIRWMYVLQKLAEGGLCLAGQIFLMGQFIGPVLSKLGAADAGVLSIAMAFGKLAIPVFVTWLLGFYQLFHVHLNVVAELMRFADREFFGQWWSATTLRDFWATWNRPVGELCLRHFYVELTHFTSASKEAAMVATFSVSAVLHEVIFSVAFKTIQPFFFLGMLAQIPLIILSRGLKGTKRGNLLMWLHLFIGFPGLMILYSIDYHRERDRFFCMPLREGWDDGIDGGAGAVGALQLAYAYLTA